MNHSAPLLGFAEVVHSHGVTTPAKNLALCPRYDGNGE
jgi:hypothetical protein